MRSRIAAFTALTVAALLLSGCTAAMPMDSKEHLKIAWRDGFDQAAQDAKATGKPILAVIAAGDCKGFC